MSRSEPVSAPPPPAPPEQDVENGPIKVDVALPSGETVSYTVDKSTPVMDFIVQLTRGNKLSTAEHVLSVLSEETGRPVDYASGQLIGPLLLLRGRKRLVLLSKADLKREQERKAEERRTAAKFETTYRVLVNLPRGVKAVYRMKLDLPVSEAFKMACADKGLDAARHFVSLPGSPMQPIDLATPLAACGRNEVCIVERPAAAAEAAADDGAAARSLTKQTSGEDELGSAPADKLGQPRRDTASSVASQPAAGRVPAPPQGPALPPARAPRKKYAAPPPPPPAAAAAPSQYANQKPQPLNQPEKRGQQAATAGAAPRPKDETRGEKCAADGDCCVPASATNGGGGHSRQSSDSSTSCDTVSLSSSTSGDMCGAPPSKQVSAVSADAVAADQQRPLASGESDGGAAAADAPGRKASVGSATSRRNKPRAPSLPPADAEISAL